MSNTITKKAVRHWFIILVVVAMLSLTACTSTTPPTTPPASSGENVTPPTTPPPSSGENVTPPTTPPPSPGESVNIDLIAKNFKFDQSTITVSAGAEVTMNFDNQDSGIPHNFALYTDSSATTPIFVGQVINGPDTITYTFTAPDTPGDYFFRCDVHPLTMIGTFTVE